MSTEEYVPSDPPTIEDWQHLERRADRNRRRGRRGMFLGAAALLVVVVAVAVGAVLYVPQRDVPKVLDNQTATLRKINQVVAGLQRFQQQQQADSKGGDLALALIVENMAAGFATPPSPDPARLKAVEGLCATARTFRSKAGDDDPPPCPAA